MAATGGIDLYILGIDIGTTGTKAILLDERGHVASTAYRSYDLIKPGMNRIEQRADDWWDAVVHTTRECLKSIKDSRDVTALSISSQGGCLIPVDSEGKPLSNAISWMDTRAQKEQKMLLELHDSRYYYERTGWQLNRSMNLCKIMWMKKNMQDAYKSADRFLSTVDYINYRMTGKYKIDPSNAAMTQMMNVRERKWDSKLLKLTGINEDMLPDITESGKLIGRLDSRAAKELGLDESVMVVSGGHDQYCAATGCGALRSGDVMLSTGTAWVLLGITGEPLFDTDSNIAVGPHMEGELWGALASIYAAGVSMEWFRDNMAVRLADGTLESFSDIDRKASERMENSKELMFYPYFNGSNFPDWAFSSKASLTGLGLEHDSYDIARAVMEAAAFNVKYALEKYRQAGCSFKKLKCIGGASRSRLWMDIISNVMDEDVIVMNQSDAACVGAAIVAGYGCGLFSSYQDGFNRVYTDEKELCKDRRKTHWYKSKYEKYRKIMKHLNDMYGSVYSGNGG